MKIIDIKHLNKTYKVSELSDFWSYITNIFTKSQYREIKALNDINLEIKKGEFIGLIGNNGAGKSTLIKIMTGILMPTNGDVHVMGRIPHKNRIKNNLKIAAVFGQRCQLRWDVSVKESYELIRLMYNVSDQDYSERLNKITQILKLDDFFEQPVRTLSLGQRMRVELGVAFLYNPEIIFLDEPTIGLDIFSKDAIIELLKVIKNETDITLILTTHDVEDVYSVCDRVIIIEEGEVLIDSELKDIENTVDIRKSLSFELATKNPIIPKKITQMPHAASDYKIVFNDVAKDMVGEVVAAITRENDVVDMHIEKMSFREILMELYSKKVG